MKYKNNHNKQIKNKSIYKNVKHFRKHSSEMVSLIKES